MAITNTEWMEQAACGSYPDPEAFHLPVTSRDPEIKRRVKAVEALCSGCDVRTDCGLYAVREKQNGMWGGLGKHARTRAVNRAKRSGAVLSKAS